MTHAETGSPPICTAIVETVADAEDVDPAELTPPLYDTIDTDALNELVAGTPDTDQTNIYVTFTYHGYEITARDDGHVTLKDGSE